jgi:hypothetical protein
MRMFIRIRFAKTLLMHAQLSPCVIFHTGLAI